MKLIIKSIRFLCSLEIIGAKTIIYKSFSFEELHLSIYYHTWTTYFSDNNSNIDELSNVYAMHYIDAKPWKVGKQYFIDMQEQYPVYSRLTLEYIKKIESYINELKERGICPSNMGMPD